MFEAVNKFLRKDSTMEEIGISEFYKGREVFVTGGTGFMGKVLIEKLLRSCPEIKTIYMLIRPKRNIEPLDRITQITSVPLFDLLKEEQPTSLSKLVPIQGDMMSLGLGISAEDKRRLIDVSVVFHTAANVRFDDPLKTAIFMNTRGTREVMELALTMPNLKALLHVSTGYCNVDHQVIEERVYPEHVAWRQAISLAENCDEHTMNILTEKYMGDLPNTYVFTKGLAEQVVQDYSDRLPCVIFRPTIVVASYDEPVPGWIDNFNGPVGLVLGAAKGVLRTIYVDENIVNDYIPVDIAIKAILVATWKRGIDKKPSPDLPVYNCSSSSVTKATIGEILDMGLALTDKYYVDDPLWTVGGGSTNIYMVHYAKVLLLHLLPALLVDSALKIAGRKPILGKLQRRVYIANQALHYFLSQTWTFRHEAFMDLIELVPEKDRKSFDFDFRDMTPQDYFERAIQGGKKYLLKENVEDMSKAKRQYDRLKIIDRCLRFVFYGFVLRFLWNMSFVQNMREFILG